MSSGGFLLCARHLISSGQEIFFLPDFFVFLQRKRAFLKKTALFGDEKISLKGVNVNYTVKYSILTGSIWCLFSFCPIFFAKRKRNRPFGKSASKPGESSALLSQPQPSPKGSYRMACLLQYYYCRKILRR